VTMRNVTMRCGLLEMLAERYAFVRELVTFVGQTTRRDLVDAPLTREGPIDSYTAVRPLR
jgi:hypothetical protein